MVVITLNRGNIHRVSDADRRWLMPTPKISLKDFRILLHRRSRATARLRLPTATSNPNLIVKQEPDDGVFDNDRLPPPPLEPSNITDTTTNPEEGEEGPSKEGGVSEEEANVRKGSGGGDFSEKSVDGSQDVKREVLLGASNPVDEQVNSLEEKPPEALENPNETSNKVEDALNGEEKRKNEVEKKLQILNAKRHNLVQALKQILNAEEELKRQISLQGMEIHSSVSLQVDAANDSELMIRIATHRLGSEGNLVGDMEGREADDILHNLLEQTSDFGKNTP